MPGHYEADLETGESYWVEDESPPEQQIPPPPPDFRGTIMGYGTRAIIDKRNTGDWITPSGEAAPPELVQDVQGTINAVDTQEMSEPQLAARIRQQAMIPQRPTDEKFNAWERKKEFLKFVEPDADAVGKQAREEHRKLYSGMDELLMNPKEHAVMMRNVAIVGENAKKSYLETADKHYDRQIEAVSRTPNEIELTQRALQGDKFAQATLDAIQKRKEDATTAAVDRKDKGLDVPALAKAVYDGQDAPIAIKGSMGNPLAAKVKTEVLKEYPKFDFNMADANYKWKQSATNQRTVNFAGGALPRLGALDDQLTKLQNVDLNVINKVMAVVSKQFGKPEYTNYESNRNAIVQEIGTALSGTSQASDLRIKIELENLESAKSPSQIRGAISNLREALIARLDVDLSPLYPLEVVRGEKTLQKFKDDMFKEFRGKYGKYGEGATATFYDNGKAYNIPADKEAAFLKARPNAKRGK